MHKYFKHFISLSLVIVLMLTASVTAFAKAETSPFDNSEFYLEGAYTIHYRVFEAENEKGKIMMIHGFALSTVTWEPLAAKLVDAGYTCVLVDLPGFGYSTRESAVADEDVIARETLIINLMKTIAPIKEWHVIGHSMGGGVSMNIVGMEPEIKSLMLVCPCPIADGSTMGNPIFLKVMGTMANFIFEEMTKVTPLLRIVAYMAFMDWDFTMNYDLDTISGPLQIHNTGYSNMVTSARAMPNDFEKISRFDNPVLVIQADKDLILNTTMKQQVADAFPDAENYLVEGGGHMCEENRADEISGVVLKFLGK
ncbi:MAG: alpha/beta hydrolase [Clostridia bacterium]|nr:alpha/beta hydrolase [Clostridia bacterium]